MLRLRKLAAGSPLVGAAAEMELSKAKRAVKTAADIMLSTPSGPQRSGDLDSEQMTWLMKTTGKATELKTARKVMKLAKELESSKPDLVTLGVYNKGPAKASVSSGPATPPTEAQLALVTYAPTVAPTQPALTAATGKMIHGVYPPRPSTTAPSCDMTRVWDFAAPHLRYGKILARAAGYVPRALHLILMVNLLLTAVHVIKHPVLAVTVAFGILDLMPSYTSFASDRITAQIRIEISKRLR